ncbi:MAG TPA: hypothetical protein VE991_01995 [Acidimicrobiales bacterium]|nr:hypothetical protein [Acidimicrobiales bacterium]
MTLVEVVVAMIVLSLAVVAVMAGMTTLAASSYNARERADVGAALRSASEVVKGWSNAYATHSSTPAYTPCATVPTPTQLVTTYNGWLSSAMPSSVLPKIGGTVDVTTPSVIAVQDATNGVSLALGCGTDTSDPGLQAVEITDSSADHKVSETLWVVIGNTP